MRPSLPFCELTDPIEAHSRTELILEILEKLTLRNLLRCETTLFC
jgi:hypothetical protein